MGRNFLGEFEQRVLLAILRCDAKAYPIDIRNEVARASGHEPSRGAFYTTLDRLEAKKLVRWTAEGGDAGRDGLPQRQFTRHAGRREGAARLAQGAARTVARPRRDAASHDGIRNRDRDQGQPPPRLADWILQARAAARQTRRKHSRRSARRVLPIPDPRSRSRTVTLVLATDHSARAALCVEPLTAAITDVSEEQLHVVRTLERYQDGVSRLHARAGHVGADRR